MRFYTKEDTQHFCSINFHFIATFRKEHQFILTLNRPEKRNAFTPGMAEEIAFALAYAYYEPEVRCIVIKAAGPVFCAGADLNAFHNPDLDQKNVALPQSNGEIILGDVFSELNKPVIAQVEGPVLAGGFLIICGCTFVVSTEEAVFGLPEVKRGIWPMQVMASLSKVVTERKALELAISGRNYTSQEALGFGLVTSIVSKENIDIEVNALADTICANAPYAIQAGISAFRQMKHIPENERHAFLKSQLEALLECEDSKEGILAFKEKRSPDWKNR